MVPRPKSHFYAASKFAVSALVEGVRNELREMGSHIRISVSCIMIHNLLNY